MKKINLHTHFYLHTDTHTHTQYPINLNEATLPDRYLSDSLSHTQKHSNFRTQWNFLSILRSNDKSGHTQYASSMPAETTDGKVNHQVSDKQKQQLTNPQIDYQRTKWGTCLGRGRSLAPQMVASTILLANTDERKNQSDIHTHLIWYSHVNTQLQIERQGSYWQKHGLVVCVSGASGVCDRGWSRVCLPAYACPWTQRCTVKCKTNWSFYVWFMQAAEMQFPALIICRI